MGPAVALVGPVEATAGGTFGALQGAGSIRRAREALQGGGHGSHGRLGLGDPTCAQFNCALGL